MATAEKKPRLAASPNSGLRRCEFRIVGHTGLCWGKKSSEPKRDDETPAQYDERVVLTRVRVDADGNCAIPAEGIKRAIGVGATRLNLKVPGGGGAAKMKARFVGGLFLARENFTVYQGGKPVKPEQLFIEVLSVPHDGNPNGKKRVDRRFPKLLGSWEAICEFMLVDEALSYDMMVRHIRAAGVFEGVGTFRIGRGMSHGMFSLATIPGTDEPDITITEVDF